MGYISRQVMHDKIDILKTEIRELKKENKELKEQLYVKFEILENELKSKDGTDIYGFFDISSGKYQDEFKFCWNLRVIKCGTGIRKMVGKNKDHLNLHHTYDLHLYTNDGDRFIGQGEFIEVLNPILVRHAYKNKKGDFVNDPYLKCNVENVKFLNDKAVVTNDIN